MERPLCERICDVSVLAFALWTLSCHVVVAAGGNLFLLLALFSALSLLTAITVQVTRRRQPRGSTPSRSPAAPRLQPTPSRPAKPFTSLRRAGLGFALVGTVVFSRSADVVLLWWWFVGLLGAAALLTVCCDEPRFEVAVCGRRQERVLLLLALGAAAFALISHRPNADDSVYINMAVSAADHPREALLAYDTLHGIPGLPLHLPAYRVHSYELLQGALSYLTGIPAIYLFHWLAAVVAALLVPYALAMFYRVLVPRHWLEAVAMTLLILVSVGGIDRWYGNFSLVRIWQGKSIFLVVFLPLIYAYAMRFAVAPNRRQALHLAAAQIAAIGCTSSALWAAPLAAGLGLLAASRLSWGGLRTLAMGLPGSVYVLLLGLHTKGDMARAVHWAKDPRPSAEPGIHLQSALTTVLGEDRLLLFAIFTLLATWTFYRGGLVRRFTVIPTFLVVLVLLNPYLAPWVQSHLTGPSYWRAFWALPLPFLMALLLIAPLSWKIRRRHSSGRFLPLAGAALFVLLIPPVYGWSPGNDVQLHWPPRLKVPSNDYRAAIALNASVPPGSSVVAPTRIGLWVPTLHHHAYPLRVRRYLDSNRQWLPREERKTRRVMRAYVSGDTRGRQREAVFRAGLRRQNLRALCLDRKETSAARTALTGNILRQEGFHQTEVGPEYEIWVRSPTPQLPLGPSRTAHGPQALGESKPNAAEASTSPAGEPHQ